MGPGTTHGGIFYYLLYDFKYHKQPIQPVFYRAGTRVAHGAGHNGMTVDLIAIEIIYHRSDTILQCVQPAK